LRSQNVNIEENYAIHEIPILTKEKLRNRNKSFKKGNSNYFTQTSGTTGPATRIYYSKKEINIPRAIQLHWMNKCGYKIGDRIIQLGVDGNRSIFKRAKDILLNTRYINVIHQSESDIEKELLKIRNKKNVIFMGYASSLYLYSKVALEHQIKNVHFKFVYSYGEMLLPNFKKSVEKAFNSKIYDTYGSSEGLMIALECDYGHYHIQSSNVIVEILDEKNQEVKEGEIGRLIVTGLQNFTTPLIRYEIGDYGRKHNGQICSCGSNLPILGGILGRSSEVFEMKNGKIITVQTLIKLLKGFEIELFQFIKIAKYQYELIVHSNSGDKLLDPIKIVFNDMVGEERLDVQINKEFFKMGSKHKMMVDLTKK
jgi:phenylacetate-CoA ligase